MKHLLIVPLILLSGYCLAQGNDAGERKKKEKTASVRVKYPRGMKYIPSGTMRMQLGTETQTNATANIRTVQLVGFYMDANEVSNEQYRQFTDYVRDSIANMMLGNYEDQPDGTRRVIMKKIKWNDPATREQLAPMYLSAAASADGVRRIDASKIQYHYETFDYKAFQAHPSENPARFIHHIDIPVYPDTTVWTKGSAAFNDPVAAQYFCSRAFNDYPVVGVNLLQCNAYCDWRTRQWKTKNNAAYDGIESLFRLPTEDEWEWAAHGGSNAIVPFVQPTTAGNVPAADFFKGLPYKAEANAYGLKNMDGSVSEWTLSGANEPETSSVTWNRPNSDNKRIVRGGSYNDEPKDQTGMRYRLHIDSSAFNLGFRCLYTEVHAKTNMKSTGKAGTSH